MKKKTFTLQNKKVYAANKRYAITSETKPCSTFLDLRNSNEMVQDIKKCSNKKIEGRSSKTIAIAVQEVVLQIIIFFSSRLIVKGLGQMGPQRMKPSLFPEIIYQLFRDLEKYKLLKRDKCCDIFG